MQKNIFLIEKHHEALRVWRAKRLKAIDVVHIDAHIDIDFRFVLAFPISRVINNAKNVKELIGGLEKNIGFMHHKRDFEKRITSGNYINAAMGEGIIKDFYWVVPGSLDDFEKSYMFLKATLDNIIKKFGQTQHAVRNAAKKKYYVKPGVLRAEILGSSIVICTLEQLPFFNHRALIDIDVDFLITRNLFSSLRRSARGKIVWMSPQKLAAKLRKKITRPSVITIAYSVLDGYTPAAYRFLGDEIARSFSARSQCRSTL